MFRGIDISEHQGAIDFLKVKESGIDFVIIRAGFGRNNIDKFFHRNIKACNDLNIPVGVYWFSYALTPLDAIKEAEYCLEAIKNYRVEYPVCFDFEYDSIEYALKRDVTITKELASNIARNFCNEIESHNYYVMNYSNLDFLNRMFDKTLSKYDLWLAHWNITRPTKEYGIWQSSSKGKINGISGYVDTNVTTKDYKEIIISKGMNNLSINKLSIEQEKDFYKTKYENLVKQVESFISKYQTEVIK